MATRRENGAGTEPKQEANGRWSLKVSYRDVETDELKRTTIRGKSQGEVLEKKKDFLRNVENGVKPNTNKILFKDWLVTWLETYKASSVTAKSYYNYENIVKNHIRDSDLGKIALNKIKRSDIQKFINAKTKELSPGTVGHVRAVIADALHVAEIDRMIIVSPCKDIQMPKRKQKEINPFSMEEAKKLLQAAEPGSMLHAIIFTGLHTGMRRGEIVGLRWDDIDFKAGKITIRQQSKIEPGKDEGKSKVILGTLKTESAYRTIPMEKNLAKVLTSYKAKQAEEKLAAGEAYLANGLVFAWPDGSIINPSTISARFKYLIQSLDIQYRTFHELRHTFASIGISRGMSIKTVSKIMGHAKIDETLDTYGHLLPGDMEGVMSVVAAFFEA